MIRDPAGDRIPRTCMRDRIRTLVVNRILSGEYPPGARIKEMVLASDCNVSQAPVREALRELEAIGLLQSERYRGTRVRVVDAGQLREAYELRALLEERAAELAVPCSADTLKKLHHELTRMQKALPRRDFEAHAESAIAFHRMLVEACGNLTFLHTWDSLHWEVRSRIAVRRLQDAGIDLVDFVEQHAAIYESLRMGDGTRAGKQVRELMESVIRAITPESSSSPAIANPEVLSAPTSAPAAEHRPTSRAGRSARHRGSARSTEH